MRYKKILQIVKIKFYSYIAHAANHAIALKMLEFKVIAISHPIHSLVQI